MKRTELISNIVIGGIGAFGQGAILAHTLHWYPFFLLTSPPARFYQLTGIALGFVAPILSLLLLYLFRSTLRPFVTAIPVVACPLIYWSLFRLVFAVSGYRYAPASTRSDFIATKSVEDGFSTQVLSLTFAGLASGVICGLVLWLLFRTVAARRTA